MKPEFEVVIADFGDADFVRGCIGEVNDVGDVVVTFDEEVRKEAFENGVEGRGGGGGYDERMEGCEE